MLPLSIVFSVVIKYLLLFIYLFIYLAFDQYIYLKTDTKNIHIISL